MSENIGSPTAFSLQLTPVDKLLAREEQVELLVGKTDTLVGQSHRFKEQSEQVRWNMWKRNAKQYLMLFALVVFILWATLSMFCGFTLRRC